MADADVDDRNVVYDGGVNGLASDAFIRSIRRRVIGQGIAKDDELVAQVAASCLGGPALDWYERQSDKVQESWKLLRQAILAQWPSSAPAASPYSNAPSAIKGDSSSSIPTPAAASPPPLPPLLPPRTVSAPALSTVTIPITSSSSLGTSATQAGSFLSEETSYTGRIRVVLDGGTPFGYIATKTDSNGDCTTTKSRDDGLIVLFTPFLHKPYEMITMGSSAAPTSYFGMSWGSEWSTAKQIDSNLAKEKLMWGGMGYLKSSPKGFSTTGSAGGPKKAAIFNVMLDGIISISWESESRAFYHIYTAICIHPGFPDHGSIQTTNNFKDLAALPAATKQGFNFSNANLVFEPL